MLDLLKRSRVARIAAACALGLAVPCCIAQDSAATYPVQGMVLDRVSGQPIARALVDANADAVLTDNDGHFELNLPGGTREINIRRPGYGSRFGGIAQAVTVGANMPDLTFYLIPNSLITGHVTLSTGDEADGIRIMAYRKRIVNGRERWTLQGVVNTNSEGAFRLANLEAPASYLLYSMPAHDGVGPIAPGATSYGYPSSYYPGVADFSAASVLTLSPGQQAQADFSLTRQPFYPVTIAVANHSEGRGIPIQIYDSSGRVLEFGTRWNPEQGTAQVNLPSGRYYAEARFGGEEQAYGRVDFTVAGGPVSGLSMAMLPLHPVPVEIRKEFTANSSTGPQGSITSGPVDFNAGLNLMLASADAFEMGGRGGGLRHVPGSTDSSLFEIENVAPGRYWVETNLFEGYVSSITSGGVDLMREPLVIGPGNATAPIEVTLRNDAGSISGQLNQSTSVETASVGTAPVGTASALGVVSRAHIYAIPLFPTASSVPQTVAQTTGQFSISNLAPGSYHVIALEDAEEIDPTDTQEIAKYTGKGQTITVEANGTANVQLDLIRTNDGAPTE